MGHRTAIVAAPLLLLLVGLGLALSIRRRRERVGPGMAGDVSFTRLQRAHGNAAEHIPVVLIGLLLLELGGPESTLVLWLGGVFVLARAAHCAGMLIRPRHPLHAFGAALTYGVEIAIGVLLAWSFLRRPSG